jgi:hypothetical protein
MMRTHQPGQAVFRSVLPEDIDWKPFPAFPPQARLAVVVGQPTGPGLYVIRVKQVSRCVIVLSRRDRPLARRKSLWLALRRAYSRGMKVSLTRAAVRAIGSPVAAA